MTRPVVEAGLAARVPQRVREAIHVVPREPARRPWGRGRPPVDPDAALTTLVAAGTDAPVLSRAPSADAGAACLPHLARLLGMRVIRLPDAPQAAAWVVGLAGAWVAGGERELARRLEVAAAAAEPPQVGSCRVAGGAGRPALRPAVLARWAGLAWRPCRWCTGGGLRGRCGGCGAPAEVRA